MADAVGADIKKILDLMALCPVSKDFCLGSCLAVLARGDMVDNGFDLTAIEYPILAARNEIVNGYRRSNLVTHDNIDLQHLCPLKRLVNQMCSKNLFCSSITHNV